MENCYTINVSLDNTKQILSDMSYYSDLARNSKTPIKLKIKADNTAFKWVTSLFHIDNIIFERSEEIA